MIPYVRCVSDAIRHIILTPLKIRVCYRPHHTLRRLLSRPRDTVPDLQKSGVVYRIPCTSCSASYIGQSGRRLEERVEEHKKAVAAADFDSSALAEHAWKRGHPVDWASVEAMSIAHNLRTRVVREAFAIRSLNNILNRDGGALPQEYES